MLTRCATNQLCGNNVFRGGTGDNVGERPVGGGWHLLFGAQKAYACERTARDRPQKGLLAWSEEGHGRECRKCMTVRRLHSGCGRIDAGFG